VKTVGGLTSSPLETHYCITAGRCLLTVGSILMNIVLIMYV